mmetsp:Transcript_23112/g.41624  ORF Transcript_23112/g.41624 Transcript_23112/m.41624 type:complete len:248 (+) Transcript_23112:246-989(+)
MWHPLITGVPARTTTDGAASSTPSAVAPFTTWILSRTAEQRMVTAGDPVVGPRMVVLFSDPRAEADTFPAPLEYVPTRMTGLSIVTCSTKSPSVSSMVCMCPADWMAALIDVKHTIPAALSLPASCLEKTTMRCVRCVGLVRSVRRRCRLRRSWAALVWRRRIRSAWLMLSCSRRFSFISSPWSWGLAPGPQRRPMFCDTSSRNREYTGDPSAKGGRCGSASSRPHSSASETKMCFSMAHSSPTMSR